MRDALATVPMRAHQSGNVTANPLCMDPTQRYAVLRDRLQSLWRTPKPERAIRPGAAHSAFGIASRYGNFLRRYAPVPEVRILWQPPLICRVRRVARLRGHGRPRPVLMRPRASAGLVSRD